MNMQRLEHCAQICLDANQPIKVLIEMPGFDKPELIINPPENIKKKMEYYKATYDENCEHKHTKGIRLVDVVFCEYSEGGTVLPAELQVGQVRYTKTTYVGDVSNDITIEGCTDDVLRIIKSEVEAEQKNATSDIIINIPTNVEVEEVVNAIKTNLEKVN